MSESNAFNYFEHVDLTLRLLNSSPQRMKLGEAKIWRGKEYYAKGLDQLLNRYTTGRECRGFVISYVKTKDIKGLFEDLRKHIDDRQTIQARRALP